MIILRFAWRTFRVALRLIYVLGGCAAVAITIMAVAEAVLALRSPPAGPPNPAVAYSQAALLRANDLLNEDARLFIRPAALQNYGALYDGLKLRPNWFPFSFIGPEITLGAPHIEASIGRINGNAVIRALGITLVARLSMSFDRIDVTDHQAENDDNCDLIFVPHVERVELVGRFQSLLQSVFPRLTSATERHAASLLDHRINEQRKDGTFPIELKLAVPRRVVFKLGIDQKDDTQFRALKSKSSDDEAPIIGTLTLKTSLPAPSITKYFNYEYPVITPSGIWLLAKAQADEPTWITLRSVQSPTSGNGVDTASVAAAEAQLSATAPSGVDIQLKLKAAPLLSLVDEIKKFTPAQRTVTISTLVSSGDAFRLQPKDKHLTFLEAFKLTADIPNDEALKGQVSLDNLSGFSSDSGITLGGTATAHASVAVRLFSDLIGLKQEMIRIRASGQSQPTPVKAHLALFQQPKKVDGKDYAAAYWGLDIDCTLISVSLTSGSGTAGGLIPIKYDELDVELQQKLFSDKAKASLVISSLPSRSALVKLKKVADKKADKKDQAEPSLFAKFLSQYRKPFYDLVPPSEGVDISIVPVAASLSATEYSLGANTTFSPATEAEFTEAEKTARSKILDALKDTHFPGEQSCAVPKPMKLVLNGVDFALGGTVAKWINANIQAEKAKAQLFLDLVKGKDTSQDVQNIGKTELDKLGYTFDGAKQTLDEMKKMAAGAQSKVDEQTNKLPGGKELNEKRKQIFGQ